MHSLFALRSKLLVLHVVRSDSEALQHCAFILTGAQPTNRLVSRHCLCDARGSAAHARFRVRVKRKLKDVVAHAAPLGPMLPGAVNDQLRRSSLTNMMECHGTRRRAPSPLNEIVTPNPPS